MRSEIVLSVRIVFYNKVHNGTSLNRTEKREKVKTKKALEYIPKSAVSGESS